MPERGRSDPRGGPRRSGLLVDVTARTDGGNDDSAVGLIHDEQHAESADPQAPVGASAPILRATRAGSTRQCLQAFSELCPPFRMLGEVLRG